MDISLVLIASLCILLPLLKTFISSKSPKTHSLHLPPGPPPLPLVGNILSLPKFFPELEPVLKTLISKYGPIITLHFGSNPAIFVSSHSLSHQALVQNGTVFADRPEPVATTRVLSSNQHNITSAFYSQTWRTFRANLTSKILLTSRMKSFSHARKWVLDVLVNRLNKSLLRSEEAICFVDHFRVAIFGLSAYMCFGAKLEEEKIEEIIDVQYRLLLGFHRFNVLNFWPRLTKILFPKLWREFLQIREDETAIFNSLIEARRTPKLQEDGVKESEEDESKDTR